MVQVNSFLYEYLFTLEYNGSLFNIFWIFYVLLNDVNRPKFIHGLKLLRLKLQMSIFLAVLIFTRESKFPIMFSTR